MPGHRRVSGGPARWALPTGGGQFPTGTEWAPAPSRVGKGRSVAVYSAPMLTLVLLACTAPHGDSRSAPDSSDSPADSEDSGPVDMLCADGTRAAPFDATAAGADYEALAGDVTIPTDAGDWTLSAAWTGCDSVVFLGVSPNDGYTQHFLDASMKKLLTKGPQDAHYVLFGDARGDDLTALQAQLRGIIDDALGNLDATQQAWWADRVHLATVNVAQAPGWVGTVFDAYRYPVVGLDRSQRIREVGYLLDPTTNWTTADWRSLGYEVEHYDFEALRSARLDAEDATVVPLWTAADTTAAEWTGVVTVDLPDAATMAGFNRVEIEVALDCGGPWYDACPAWDTSDYVWRCANDDPGTQDDESAQCEEMARVITGYWRGGRWVMDARHELPWLLDGGAHTFRFNGGGMVNIVTVNLRLFHEAGAPTPFGGTQLWWDTSGFWDATYDSRNADHTFTVPADATRVELVTIATGHGNDGHGCGEFCAAEQTFTVNGTAGYDVSFPEAGSSDGCVDHVGADGALPNQAGTWTYGRNGWCPGMGVAPVAWDVTAASLPGADNALHYQALLNGAPYVTDADGNLDMGVWVVWSR